MKIYFDESFDDSNASKLVKWYFRSEGRGGSRGVKSYTAREQNRCTCTVQPDVGNGVIHCS